MGVGKEGQKRPTAGSDAACRVIEQCEGWLFGTLVAQDREAAPLSSGEGQAGGTGQHKEEHFPCPFLRVGRREGGRVAYLKGGTQMLPAAELAGLAVVLHLQVPSCADPWGSCSL